MQLSRLALLAALVLVVGACGGDDDKSAATTGGCATVDAPTARDDGGATTPQERLDAPRRAGIRDPWWRSHGKRRRRSRLQDRRRAPLPPEYAIVGKVTDALETVPKIDALGAGDGATSIPVVIEKITPGRDREDHRRGVVA